jgi:hypothetical protein
METVTQTLIQAGPLLTEQIRALIVQEHLLRIETAVLMLIQTGIPTRIPGGPHPMVRTLSQVTVHNGLTGTGTDTVTTRHRLQTVTDVQV